MKQEVSTSALPQYSSWTRAQALPVKQLLTPDRPEVLRRIETLGRIMDDLYLIPGTSIRVGLDTFIGLVPGVGDAVTTAISSYVIWEARRMGVSKWTLAKMVKNVGIDFVVGAVPLVGDLFDVAFRANRKNIKLLHEELLRTQSTSQAAHLLED